MKKEFMKMVLSEKDYLALMEEFGFEYISENRFYDHDSEKELVVNIDEHAACTVLRWLINYKYKQAYEYGIYMGKIQKLNEIKKAIDIN